MVSPISQSIISRRLPPLEEALARLLAVHQNAGPAEIPRDRDAEALLGGAPKPTISVSEAFEVNVGEIAYNAQLYKSPNQRASWEKAKRTSIQYFIDFTGDSWHFSSRRYSRMVGQDVPIHLETMRNPPCRDRDRR